MKREVFTLTMFCVFVRAFGDPTQAELEGFLNAQSTNIDVCCKTVGNLNFPTRIVLKNEEAKKDWERFSKSYDGICEHEECGDTVEGLGEISKDAEIAPINEGEVAVESFEEHDIITSGVSEEQSLDEFNVEIASLFGTVEDTEGDDYSMPKKLTPERRRAYFKKYSREATAEELALVKGWGVKGLRFVDFDSIVNGLDDEAQKEKCFRLIKKENEAELLEEIDRWVGRREIRNTYDLRVFDSDSEEPTQFFAYTIASEIIENFRGSLKMILKNMAGYEAPRKTLILALVLLEDCKIIINPENVSLNDFGFQFCPFNSEELDIQLMFHELNLGIHDHLGICAHRSLVGKLNSKLEQELFRFFDEVHTAAAPILPPASVVSCLLRENEHDFSEDGQFCRLLLCSDFEEFLDIFGFANVDEFYRFLQMSLLWSEFEEVWNIIGFANVDDDVYINRMSDANLLQKLRFFHGRECKFTDPKFLGLEYNTDVNISEFPFIVEFLKKMDETFEKHAEIFNPTDEALKLLLKLHNREDVGADFFTVHIETFETLIEKIKKIKLIGKINPDNI